jgi:hypothetical protein
MPMPITKASDTSGSISGSGIAVIRHIPHHMQP